MEENPQWEYIRLNWYPGSIGGLPEQQRLSHWYIDDRQWAGLLDALNDLGKDGWECVSVVVYPTNILGTFEQYVILKRISPEWMDRQRREMRRRG